MNEGKQMMPRAGRISAVVLSIVFLAALAAGCFGAGGQTSGSTSYTSVPSSGTTATSVQASTTDTAQLVNGLPAAYADALGKRPIVVLFYVPGGVDDEQVLSTVRGLQSTYSAYTFLLYDYRIPSAYGDLSEKLAIDYQPEIVLIDRHGEKQNVWSGYVDKGTLNQTLLNLGRY